MRLQELFITALAEKRRNPQLNPKNTGHQSAVAYLRDQGDLGNWGVSMTGIAKLGINPGSSYNTPIGIYFYPAKYYLEKKRNGQALDFQDDAEYIQIFQYAGNIINLSELTDEDFKKYIQTMRYSLDSVAKTIGYTGDDEHDENDIESRSMSSEFEKIVSQSQWKARVAIPGGQLWYVLYQLSGMSQPGTRSSRSAGRSSIVWNKLFRLIGIDGAVDQGSGVIHENEPTQGVIFTPSVISHANTIQSHDKEASLGSIYRDFAKDAQGEVDSKFISNVIFSVEMERMIYNARYAKECRTILSKCYQYLIDNPIAFVKSIGPENLKSLLKLANNNAVVSKFYIAYYRAMWTLNKAAFNEMKKDFDYDGEHAYFPSKELKHKHKTNVEIIKRLMNQLRRFRSQDEVIAFMYNYCDAIVQYITTAAAAAKAELDSDKI